MAGLVLALAIVVCGIAVLALGVAIAPALFGVLIVLAVCILSVALVDTASDAVDELPVITASKVCARLRLVQVRDARSAVGGAPVAARLGTI